MDTEKIYKTDIVNAFTNLLEEGKELKDKLTQATTAITKFPYFMDTGDEPEPYIYYLHRQYKPVTKRIYIPIKLHIIAFFRQKIIHQIDAIPPSFMEDEKSDTA
ncbi:hypothetical protein AB840_12175 [Megasphaera cerevisiae DSM 20462]|uniref:Uncharacterized protein n=1 Tax=Megasphaera cerevisiae DSM 20462 TaxID=1122219 RepID=A0A0J6ZLF0_9FIRM|nr:hypothetical protein [Megasphaera cerevisiae]KMO85686.1 hypothetical protein AB840_12175 [Megasphaera cerevisiae DSM 20462]SKA11315.1 hypothetical protein SAMN05660900_02461 [Megasphaera cerevisiae DSM 20462]